MPGWKDVLEEIRNLDKSDSLDLVRRKYLKLLNEKRKRNIIAYYSGWLQSPRHIGTEINDIDKNAFMAAIHKLDRQKGLDLILHTHGGDALATESLVDYLQKMFNLDIEVFIPQIAMSAGTMIACASKKIYMGKQSNIGPIDPQLGGVPTRAVLDEFERASQEIKDDPTKIPLWQSIIGQYHPTFILQCENSIAYSEEVVSQWLKKGMFVNDNDRDKKVKDIIEKLSDHNKTKFHGRHISNVEAKEIGLIISDLEDDDELQDLVLTVHHAFMQTFAHTSCLKIIENHNGVATILKVQSD